MRQEDKGHGEGSDCNIPLAQCERCSRLLAEAGYDVEKEAASEEICRIEGCGKVAPSDQLCVEHYTEVIRG